jgi:RNA polymerase primary sigma factor
MSVIERENGHQYFSRTDSVPDCDEQKWLILEQIAASALDLGLELGNGKGEKELVEGIEGDEELRMLVEEFLRSPGDDGGLTREDLIKTVKMALELVVGAEEEPDQNGEGLGDEVTHWDLGDVSVDDHLGMYFIEMSQAPLLSAEEEVALAKQIELGKVAYEQLALVEGLNGREELELVIEQGKMARGRMIRSNTRLVVSIAKKYRGRGLQFLDLIQEGNIGLMKAVEKFDYRRGNRFSTYATWWIRQAVSRAVANQGRTIRLPAYVGSELHALDEVSRDLEQELGRQPMEGEIAEAMGVTIRVLQRIIAAGKDVTFLDPKDEGDDERPLLSRIEDVTSPNPAVSSEQDDLRLQMSILLEGLSPREVDIIRLRFGMGGEDPLTLKEVGDRYNLSRERIRQLEKEALKKLRGKGIVLGLREYL